MCWLPFMGEKKMEMIYMNRNYIKEHPKARKTLRIIGFIVLPVGLALMIIADIFFLWVIRHYFS